MRRVRNATTSWSARIWRSANCLTSNAPNSSSSGAPIRTGQAVSSRERRSGSRTPQPATGRPRGEQQAAAALGHPIPQVEQLHLLRGLVGIVDDAGRGGLDPPQRLRRLPQLGAAQDHRTRALRPDLGQVALAARGRPDQDTGRPRPSRPAQHRVEGLAVGGGGHEVGQAVAVSVRQVQHQLARQGRGLARRRRGEPAHRGTRASTQIRPADCT